METAPNKKQLNIIIPAQPGQKYYFVTAANIIWNQTVNSTNSKIFPTSLTLSLCTKIVKIAATRTLLRQKFIKLQRPGRHCMSSRHSPRASSLFKSPSSLGISTRWRIQCLNTLPQFLALCTYVYTKTVAQLKIYWSRSYPLTVS